MGLTTPSRKKQIVTRSEKATVAFEEAQGPHRAVEPVMVMPPPPKKKTMTDKIET
jgi:hypothetical protein